MPSYQSGAEAMADIEASTSASKHQYAPLTGSNEIRVLSLSGTKLREPLSFRLRALSLGWDQNLFTDCQESENDNSSNVNFDALSYVWFDPMDPNQPKTIYVDGKSFEISQNLYSALLQVYTKWPLKYLWVDQICIDQGSISEKNQQVPLMSKIYGRALKIHIWLGLLRKNLEKPTQLVFHFCNVAWHPSINTAMSDSFIPKEELEKQAFEVAVEDITSRVWFQRTWTFQEIILARDAVVWIGPIWVLWHAFALGIKKALSLQEFVMPSTQGFHPVSDLVALWEKKATLNHSGTGNMTLTDYLVITGPRKATDLRDKVFGIRGLLEERIALSIKVDYNASEAAVFQNAMRCSVILEEDLGLLASAGIWRNDSKLGALDYDLPSWVPDFSNLRHPVDYTFSHLRQPSNKVVCTYDTNVPNRIGLRGFVLGRISRVPAPFNGAHLIPWNWDGTPQKYDWMDEATVRPLPKCAIAAASATLYEIEDIFDPELTLQPCDSASLAEAVLTHDKDAERCISCSAALTNQQSKARVTVSIMDISQCVQVGDWLCLFQGSRLPCLLRLKVKTPDYGDKGGIISSEGYSKSEACFDLVTTCFPSLIPRADLRRLEDDPDNGDWHVGKEWRNEFSCIYLDFTLV
ncbi:hypothetical protein N431DRAFT_560556 [Stipitochalara longipes BDJ]|nr:hypothetical protein N431DRAFT_560556 [Stipitochalara longipes BDJ]